MPLILPESNRRPTVPCPPIPMQSPDTTDAPIVPNVSTDSRTEPAAESGTALAFDGGPRPPERPLDRPPRTDHTTAYGRDTEEIEPLVPDLR